MMRANRKVIAVGATALGLAGAIAGGIGVAQAATTAPGQAGPRVAAATTAQYGHGPGMGARTQGEQAGQRVCFSAAASYLGLSETDLRARLQSGKSLADVANAQGKSVSGLQEAMIAAAAKAVEGNTSLTSDQKTEFLTQAKNRIATMINTAHATGQGRGMMGGAGRHGMR